jgi:hypothetical protein
MMSKASADDSVEMMSLLPALDLIAITKSVVIFFISSPWRLSAFFQRFPARKFPIACVRSQAPARKRRGAVLQAAPFAVHFSGEA